MIDRAQRWRELVDSEGDDSAETADALQIFRERFDPLWTQAQSWHCVHRSELHWDDLEKQNPRLAKAARDFSMAVKAAMKGLLPMRHEVIIEGIQGRVHPNPAARNWRALDLMRDTLEELRYAFEEGPIEIWIPASEAEKHTQKLGKPVGLVRINRLAKQGKFKVRVSGPGSKHKSEVEVGTFFRWLFAEHGDSLKA